MDNDKEIDYALNNFRSKEEAFQLFIQFIDIHGINSFWNKVSVFLDILKICHESMELIKNNNIFSSEELLILIFKLFKLVLLEPPLEYFLSYDNKREEFLILCYLITHFINIVYLEKFSPKVKTECIETIESIYNVLPLSLKKEIFPGVSSFSLKLFLYKRFSHKIMNSNLYLFKSLIFSISNSDLTNISISTFLSNKQVSEDDWTKVAYFHLHRNIRDSFSQLYDSHPMSRGTLCSVFISLLPVCNIDLGLELLKILLSYLTDATLSDYKGKLIEFMNLKNLNSVYYKRSVEDILIKEIMLIPKHCNSCLTQQLIVHLNLIIVSLELLNELKISSTCISLDKILMSFSYCSKLCI